MPFEPTMRCVPVCKFGENRFNTFQDIVRVNNMFQDAPMNTR